MWNCFTGSKAKPRAPSSADVPTFKPLMLSNPLEDKDWEALDLKDMAVEWKWDGIRVQFASKGNVVSLFSRNGDNIGAAFPEIVGNQNFKGILDGELLVKHGESIASFSDLQQRLNRKTVNSGSAHKIPGPHPPL